jgi:hypothetical protein
LAATGGALKQIRLSGAALAALAAIRTETGETISAVIERLLRAAARP